MKTSYFAQKKVLDADPNICPISIARYQPNWWPILRTYDRLAPEPQMVRDKYTRTEFELIVLSNRNPKICHDALHVMAQGKEPVLLCYEAPPFSENNWCHRRIVAEWFELHLGILVPEYSTKKDYNDIMESIV